MIAAGLTGNYGAGKSAVAGIFKELGAVIISADNIVHGLLQDKDVIYEIRRVFGDSVIENSSINKRLLADIVFKNPPLRIGLEDILHPRVFRKIREELSKIPVDSSAIVIIEAPVIFERCYQNRFDKIITVTAPEEIAIARLKSKGIAEEKAIERLKNQFSGDMKAGQSDFAIDNSGDLQNTARQVEEIYQKLLLMDNRHGNN